MVLIEDETPFHKASLYYVFTMRMFNNLPAFQYPFNDVCTEETYVRKNNYVSTYMEELSYRERVHNEAYVWFVRFITDNLWFVEALMEDITSIDSDDKKDAVVRLRFRQLWGIYKSQHNLHDAPFSYRCTHCDRLVETEVYGDYLLSATESGYRYFCGLACERLHEVQAQAQSNRSAADGEG